jgi:SAM-dependent methyltransferase
MKQVDVQAAQLREAITGGWRTRLIHAGVSTGLFDALGGAPRSAEDIAAERGLHAPTVFRVLRALATFGLCDHVGCRDFAETALGARLKADAPGSMRGLALFWGGRVMEQLDTIADTLATGEPGHGGGDFARLLADPVQGDIFCRAMAEQSVPVARALAEAVDFGRFDRVMDVGGGYGGVLAEILRAYPAVQGLIFDLDLIAAGARRYLEEAGVGDRADFLAGSFFTEVPGAADCLVLKFILHDWSDPQAATIMANCRKALPAGGTVIIVEKLLPETVGPGDESVVRSDLVMLPVNGKERTLAEYREIGSQAGFTSGEHIPLVDDCHAILFEAAALA